MATMYDVARKARVSSASVSAVINGKEGEVSPETRRRILDAIHELNYRPNRIARQLKTGTFDTIALTFERAVYHEYQRPEIHYIISGVDEVAADRELDVLFIPTGKKRGFIDTIQNLGSRGIDGGIVVGPIFINPVTIEAIENSEVPIVCIDSYPGFTRVGMVDVDNAGGVRIAVEHLIRLGHKNISFFGHPPVFQCYADRIRAFCEVMQDNGFPVNDDSLHLVMGELAAESITASLQSLNRPTAVVCGEGSFGRYAWEAASKLGINIPAELEIAVFDGLPERLGVNPIISIIRDPFEQGKAAAELLMQLISGQTKTPVSRTIMPKVFYGDTILNPL